jgi:hypothetical protein
MSLIRTMSVVLTILFLMPLPVVAGSGAVQGLGVAFDLPEGVVFREYPSIPGGRFIPVSHLENRYYHAVVRLEVFWDQWSELGTEHFIKKWAVLACAADGAGSSQWCDETSLNLESFMSSFGIRGHKVKRRRIVETYGNNGTEKREFTDLIITFDIKDRINGQNRLAAFVCEDESCFDLVQIVGKSFR